jgi:ABC-2 type transport system permease protein
MREFWILTKLQVSSLFGINKILHMKNKDEKKQGKRALGGLIAMVFAMGYMSVLYSFMLARAFQMLGTLPTLLGIMALASSLLILIFSIFETKGVLFGFGDFDIVMSWPVDVRAVAASRVFSMYANNFVYAFLLMLPAGVIYAIMAAPPLWYYPLFLLLIFLVPALPTIVGALLGTLLTVATARMKKSNLMSVVVQMVLVFGLMIVSMRSGMALEDPTKLANFAEVFRPMIRGMYPPAQWFQDALATGSLPSVLWLLLLTAGSIAVLIFWLGKNFVSVNSRIKSKPRGETFVMQQQVHSTKASALFKRELKRYFSSSLYVVNTAFGYVMMIAAGIALFIKADEVLKFLDMPDVPSITGLVPFVLGWMVSMGATTASAISLEGKSLWIIKSLPVSARDWLAAKLKVSLTLAIPSIFITGTLVVVGLKPGFLDAIWIFLLPLAYAFAFGVMGLWVNIRMSRLDWQTEAEAIKQGGATMISVFVGMAAAFIPAIVGGATGSPLVAPITCALLAGMTIMMWSSLMRSGEKRMLMLH